MGLADQVLAFRRQPQEQRSEWGSSAIPPPGGVPSNFAAVSLSQAESALQQVAIDAATDLIASVAGQLPVDTYKRNSDGAPKNIGNPRVIEDPDGTDNGTGDWVYQYLMSKLLRGNVYGRQAFDGNAYPTHTVLYHPDEVHGWRDRQTGDVRWRIDGKLVEDPSKVWHRRSYPMPGRLLGLSPIEKHITTIQLGISAERFGAQFFTDGAVPSALLTNEETDLDQKAATTAKSRWMAAIWGTREPAVLGKGWKYHQISINPDDAQFLETNKYTSAQCARIYGPNVAEILGYETGGSMTYTNVEQRSIDFLKFTLNRWLRDLETTMSLWLPRGQFIKFNRNALLETDLLTRFKAYQIGIGAHFLAPSEAREFEDQPPLTAAQKKELESVPAQKTKPSQKEDDSDADADA